MEDHRRDAEAQRKTEYKIHHRGTETLRNTKIKVETGGRRGGGGHRVVKASDAGELDTAVSELRHGARKFRATGLSQGFWNLEKTCRDGFTKKTATWIT
jgi:hypothetical protein